MGLLDNMAYDNSRDGQQEMRDVRALLLPSTTYIGLRRDGYLRGYAYAFIELLAPHYNRKAVEAELKMKDDHQH